ncbi:Transcriptional regulator, contains XRE-family HTH domain [Pseudomonas sp. URIL14HWK12:I9]|nr:transcriptional regulator with XRE-family HTH domain [Pseudomonas sp. URIL14HWK12:I12]PVZ21773.1 transcriptional regulator with XRE-family HTH domain [Pseudomonas sp. URIL14HWK12:I10]PVZ31144.1 transcriptional regulator with XRE-family HTH domain [Pseudomonas sp. URIL14HWK12:I11]SNZ17863.1 Transcriptional regulator, contains XRE-family HTH domain [Pseudomonas sp. URIL14HWK12:I9]
MQVCTYSMTPFCKRLKQARLAAGFSQERLGIEAGIEPASASARMNQYETGKHVPNPATVQQVAKVLGLPAAFFYCDEDDLARMVVAFHRLPQARRGEVLEQLEKGGQGARLLMP